MKRVLLALLLSTLACASSTDAPAPKEPERTAKTSAATIDDLRADNVFGQPDFDTGVEPAVVSIYSARRPAGLTVGTLAGGLTLTIADRGNHRVRSILASSFTPAATGFHLGQNSWDAGEANAGAAVSYGSLSAPSAVAQSTDGRYAVADTDNHRVVIGYLFSLPSWVAGQLSSFASATRNNGGLSSQSLAEPHGVAWQPNSSFGGSRLYIADSGNHRLLVYTDPSFALATWVIGQHNDVDGTDLFTKGLPNDGKTTPTSSSLRDPRGLAISPFETSPSVYSGVWVADTGNHRVLRFPECPSFEGLSRPCPTANFVIGQKDFTTADPSAGGVSAFSLDTPTAVAIDRQGGLWVADTGHHRVLHFKRGSTKADRVLGQPDFETATAPTIVSAQTLSAPTGVAVDSNGDLYVADTGSNRILRYQFVATPDSCDDGDPCTDDSVVGGRCSYLTKSDTKACVPYRCDLARHACYDTCSGGAGCQLGWTCTSTGKCVKSCTRPDFDCGEGRQCVDGWCCDGACKGTCEACNVIGNEGSCVAVYGAPLSSPITTTRRACARAGLDDPECAGQCDGFHRNTCVAASAATSCGPETCTDGVATLRGACDGHGKCIFVKQPCAPYACAPNGCRTDCSAAHHCSAGSDCVAGQCVPAADQKIGGVGCDVRDGGATDGHAHAWLIACGVLGVIGLARRRRGGR